MTNLKQTIFEACLCRGNVAIVVLPAQGLNLPPEVGLPTRLDYGLQMAKPIDDLEVTESGIRATLSFSNEPRATFVPWDAVLAIALADGSSSSGWMRTEGRTQAATPARPKLRAV